MQCMLNSRTKVVHTNIKFPNEIKNAQYFQLSSWKDMRKSRLAVRMLYIKKSVYLCVILKATKKLDLLSQLILLQSSPSLTMEEDSFRFKDLTRVS